MSSVCAERFSRLRVLRIRIWVGSLDGPDVFADRAYVPNSIKAIPWKSKTKHQEAAYCKEDASRQDHDALHSMMQARTLQAPRYKQVCTCRSTLHRTPYPSASVTQPS